MQKDYQPLSTPAIKNFWQIKDFSPTKIKTREEFKLMQPYLSKLSSSSRLLDGGCGLGEWTRFFSDQGFKTIGLDINPQIIKVLKKKFPSYDFRTGDIRNTKLKANSIDAYFSWGTFEHFESGLGDCLKEAYRILKPKGYLFISVPFQNWRHIIHQHRHSSSKNPFKAKFYQWRLTKKDLSQELLVNGFKILTIKPIHKGHGLYRLVKHDFGIDPKYKLHRFIQILLYPLVPKNYASHMLFTIAQKQ